MNLDFLGSSKNTTLLGISTILVAVASAVIAIVDGDPRTLPDWGATLAAITAGIGLLKAKDANVSNSPSPGPAVVVPPAK